LWSGPFREDAGEFFVEDLFVTFGEISPSPEDARHALPNFLNLAVPRQPFLFEPVEISAELRFRDSLSRNPADGGKGGSDDNAKREARTKED
jgi:hypothetical protein